MPLSPDPAAIEQATKQRQQINPYIKLGDMNLTTEELVIAVYTRGQRIMQQDVQIQTLTERNAELEKAHEELVRERDGLKALLEKPVEEKDAKPTEMRKAS